MMKTLICLCALTMAVAGCCGRNGQSKNACNMTKDNCNMTECAMICKDSAELVMNISKKAKPESVEAYKELFAKCQAVTLTEDGCIEYALFQSVKDSTEFLIFERWTSKQKQAEHAEREHVKEFLKASEGVLDAPTGGFFESYICR